MFRWVTTTSGGRGRVRSVSTSSGIEGACGRPGWTRSSVSWNSGLTAFWWTTPERGMPCGSADAGRRPSRSWRPARRRRPPLVMALDARPGVEDRARGRRPWSAGRSGVHSWSNRLAPGRHGRGVTAFGPGPPWPTRRPSTPGPRQHQDDPVRGRNRGRSAMVGLPLRGQRTSGRAIAIAMAGIAIDPQDARSRRIARRARTGRPRARSRDPDRFGRRVSEAGGSAASSSGLGRRSSPRARRGLPWPGRGRAGATSAGGAPAGRARPGRACRPGY